MCSSARLLPVCMLGVALGVAGCKRAPAAPDDHGALPEFLLTDHQQQPFGLAQMKGSLWVVNFIFTSCPTICPKLTATMAGLRTELAGTGVSFLSISVDPENDTPDVLRRYAQERGAAHANWRFATGDASEVRKTVVSGFRLAMGDRTPVDGQRYDIMHASHFVVVDGAGHIRGYYRTDTEGQRALKDDIRTLLLLSTD